MKKLILVSSIILVVMAISGAVFSTTMILNQHTGVEVKASPVSSGFSKLCDPLDPTCPGGGGGMNQCPPHC